MKTNIQIVLVFGLMINLAWTLAIADEETTFASSSEQSSTEPSTITFLTTSNATTETSTFKPRAIKIPAKIPSSDSSGTERKPKEKVLRESGDCDEQLLIYEDRIADLEIKLAAYSQQKKALTSVMKIVLELLMNEVSLVTEDDLDRKS